MSDQRLRYLDGLRGILAVIVFVHHFLYAFYPSFVFGGEAANFATGRLTIERIFALTPLNLLFNPGMAINLFFLLSGYAQSLHYFQKPEILKLKRSLIKRYFRLAIPTLTVVIMVLLFHRLKLIDKTSIPSHPLTYRWCHAVLPDNFNLPETLLYGLVDCFKGVTPEYQILWTMPVELFNSWLVIILLMVTHRFKNKLPVFIFWFLVQLFFLRSFYGLSFTLGLILCYLELHSTRFKTTLSNKFIKMLCFIVGLYFASFPFTGYETSSRESMYYPISFFDYYPNTICYAFGNLLLFCVLLNSKTIQQFLSGQLLCFFGDISFMFYLLHFLILFSFFPWLFVRLSPYLHTSAANYVLTGIASFCIVTLLSFILYKIIDLPVLKMSNSAVKRVFRA